MSTSAIQSGNPIDQLAKTLFRAYDTNSDGKLSSDEFAKLVTNLTGAVASAGGTSSLAATSGNYTTPVLSTASAERARNAMDGFDSAKIANLEHRTPKYLFARVAQYASLDGVTDKATAETVLRGMTTDLKAAGLEVIDVKGDKIQINIEGHDTWIDVIHGANSGSPSFQWLPVE
jgi:hypothetical protein